MHPHVQHRSSVPDEYLEMTSVGAANWTKQRSHEVHLLLVSNVSRPPPKTSLSSANDRLVLTASKIDDYIRATEHTMNNVLIV